MTRSEEREKGLMCTWADEEITVSKRVCICILSASKVYVCICESIYMKCVCMSVSWALMNIVWRTYGDGYREYLYIYLIFVYVAWAKYAWKYMCLLQLIVGLGVLCVCVCVRIRNRNKSKRNNSWRHRR